MSAALIDVRRSLLMALLLALAAFALAIGLAISASSATDTGDARLIQSTYGADDAGTSTGTTSGSGLARTGYDLTVPLTAVGAGLVLAGASSVILARRARRTETAPA